MSATRVCRRCLVSGRVQGVFYRATVARRARELGLDGYARNLPDGRVEVLACGSPAAIESFMSALWTGSSTSKVSDVAAEAVEEPGGSVRGFATA
ncbi:MAG TPA: acylphosphatase [Steroidobacteraceae bacterium]|nr:acylphosphatase [Steroidobacteraceae bacterium]